MHGSRGGGGTGQDPLLKITKIYVFLAILVRIPWKITKQPRQHSMSGYHRPASETPFKWPFAGWPMMARFKCYMDPLSSPHQLKKPKKRQIWTPSDKTFWIRACPRWNNNCPSICFWINSLSACNLWKQFGPKSGRCAWSYGLKSVLQNLVLIN